MARRFPWRLSLWIAALLLAGAGAALAQGPGAPGAPKFRPGLRPGPVWHDARPGMMLRRLGLDEAQTVKVKALHLKAEKERVRQEAQIRIAEIELRELMAASPAPDRGKIHAQIDQLAGLRGGMEKLETDLHLDVLDLLTPEQRQKLESLREQGPRFEMRLREPVGDRRLRLLRPFQMEEDDDDEDEDED